jgi:nonribosomal peptide synthetase DhbF
MQMVMALLATLKAGAAYLPLDPEYPQARLAQMISDAAPKLILTSPLLRQRLWQTADVPVLELETEEIEAELRSQPLWNPSDAERVTPLLPEHLHGYTQRSGDNPQRHRESAVMDAIRVQAQIG